MLPRGRFYFLRPLFAFFGVIWLTWLTSLNLHVARQAYFRPYSGGGGDGGGGGVSGVWDENALQEELQRRLRAKVSFPFISSLLRPQQKKNILQTVVDSMIV